MRTARTRTWLTWPCDMTKMYLRATFWTLPQWTIHGIIQMYVEDSNIVTLHGSASLIEVCVRIVNAVYTDREIRGLARVYLTCLNQRR